VWAFLFLRHLAALSAPPFPSRQTAQAKELKKMRIANVVYVTEATGIPQEVEIEAELKGLGFDPRWNVAAATSQGWPTPQRAALELMQRGAHRVDFTVARWEPEGGLTLLDSHMKRAC
jgi:hypothetical protein